MIPLALTTVAVYRPDPDADPYVPRFDAKPRCAGVRATIGMPSGREASIAGGQTITDKLNCDVCDIEARDLVRDETTGDWYEAVWVRRRVGLGLDHLAVGLAQTVMASDG